MRPIVGLIPAAGRATRLGDAITGSKEVLDVGGSPVTGYLLDSLHSADVQTVVIAVRPEKWDIVQALQRYREQMTISYVVVGETPSAAHTVAAAMSTTGDRLVALGFPDIMFQPRGAYSDVIAHQRTTDADVVLGLFPSGDAENVDMVEVDDRLRPRRLVIKQPDEGLRYSWAVTVWTPRFSRHLAEFVGASAADGDELHVGHAIQSAIDDGLGVEAVAFDDGNYLDIGTPESLALARALHDSPGPEHT